jgi:hypothetical protein
MATKVYYRKGKGPYGTGESHADRYTGIQREVLNLCARNDPKARNDMAALHDAMRGMAARHTGKLGELADRMSLGQRDVGPGDVQGVPILSNLSVAYSSGDLIGMELLPPAPVDQLTGNYTIYPRRDRMQVVRGEGRGRRGRSNEIPQNESEGTYTTAAHTHKGHMGLDAIIAGRLAQKRAPMDRLARMVDDVGYHHQLEHEAKAIEVLTNTSNFGADYKLALTAGLHWDEATGEIAKNLDDARQVIWGGQGSGEVVFATSRPIWNVIRRNTSLVGLKSANDRGFVKMEEFAEAFDIDGVMVSDLRLDAANIGQPEDPQSAWGNYAMLIRVSRTPQQMNACWGYTMRWNANDIPSGGGETLMNGNNGVFTRLWFDPDFDPFGAFRYKMADYWGIEIVAADTGFLWSDVLATFPS